MATQDEVAWPADPVALPEGPGDLQLENIVLNAGGRTLLDGLSVQVPAGTKLRITGSSGAGKSTFLSLLQRHADPASGRILLDGIDLRSLSREDVRGAVACVPQRPFVIEGSVAENLSLSAAGASPNEMSDMLKLVGLSGRFASHGGLDAWLGEDGLTLSGGERQRLCVARALLRPFRILILDEAMSEVDADSVNRIAATIDERFADRTRIIVTHGNETAYGVFDRTINLEGFTGK